MRKLVLPWRKKIGAAAQIVSDIQFFGAGVTSVRWSIAD
jgi:hypothetical protein